jgi:hypothetical protein
VYSAGGIQNEPHDLSTAQSCGQYTGRNVTAKDHKVSPTTRDNLLVSPRMRASSLCLIGGRRGRQLASGCQQSCVRASPLHRRGRIRNVYTWCRFLVYSRILSTLRTARDRQPRSRAAAAADRRCSQYASCTRHSCSLQRPQTNRNTAT